MEKLANTLENKAKFLLHCYAENKDSIKSYQGSGVVFGILDIINNPENYYAELTPLSQITDEDLVYMVQGELGDNDNYEDLLKHAKDKLSFMILGCLSPCNVDRLRRMGYAYDYSDLSVDDLISYGWVKLKEDKC